MHQDASRYGGSPGDFVLDGEPGPNFPPMFIIVIVISLELGMRGIPVQEKYRGIKSDGIIYRGLPKYRGIPSGDIDVQ